MNLLRLLPFSRAGSERLLDILRASYWFVPGLLMLFAVILATVLLAQASDRYDPRLMLGGFFFCGALCFMAVGIGAPDLGWLIATGVLTGFFAGGAQVGLYPVATQIYPAAVRVTGVAWAQVWGRIGSIIGPWLGGLLLWLGLGEYFVVFGAPLLLAAVAIWMMRPASRADDAAQVAPAMASAAPSTRR